jgi:hypothetical protein
MVIQSKTLDFLGEGEHVPPAPPLRVFRMHGPFSAIKRLPVVTDIRLLLNNCNDCLCRQRHLLIKISAAMPEVQLDGQSIQKCVVMDSRCFPCPELTLAEISGRMIDVTTPPTCSMRGKCYLLIGK